MYKKDTYILAKVLENIASMAIKFCIKSTNIEMIMVWGF